MTTNDSGMENGIEPRTQRACEEPMVVVPEREGTGLFEVWSGTNTEPYVVDLAGQHDRCTCPDMEYNLEDGERCKHVRRVRMEFGLPPFEDVPSIRSEHSAPMDVELARRRRGIDVEPEPEPITVEQTDTQAIAVGGRWFDGRTLGVKRRKPVSTRSSRV